MKIKRICIDIIIVIVVILIASYAWNEYEKRESRLLRQYSIRLDFYDWFFYKKLPLFSNSDKDYIKNDFVKNGFIIKKVGNFDFLVKKTESTYYDYEYIILNYNDSYYGILLNSEFKDMMIAGEDEKFRVLIDSNIKNQIFKNNQIDYNEIIDLIKNQKFKSNQYFSKWRRDKKP